tara:strand:+ start:560 stop:874 length:315 start_codon:yes stop_codon:yes gene_type:complete
MAVIVKSSIKITKGFDTWQKMVKSQDEKLKELGIKFLFAGTEKDDQNQLHAIMIFPSMETLQAFGADQELTEIRKQAGAVIESGVMTPISGDYFTNYPDAFIKH